MFQAMIDWSSCEAVEQHPERCGGAWVFRGTRVPVAALFENLEDDAQANGALLAAAEADGFDVMVTTDLNLQYQQRLAERTIAIVVLSTTSWPRIRAATEDVVRAIEASAASRFVEVRIP